MGGFLGFLKSVAGPLTGGLLGGAANVGGTYMSNKAGMRMQEDAQAFSAAQGQIGRDWQEQMYGQEMAFNSAQSAKQYGREKLLRRTQYQTAVTDMQKAGLNPMLAYSQGGAGTPNVSTASVGSAGSPSVGRSTAYQPRSYGEAGSAAVQMARQIEEVKNLSSQNRLINAQADEMEKRVGLTEATTSREAASAAQLYASRDELKERVTEVRQHVTLMEQETTESSQRTDLHFIHGELMRLQAKLADKEVGVVEAREVLLKVEAQLKRFDLPEARNRAREHSREPLRTYGPYAKYVGEIFGSAAQMRGAIRPSFKFEKGIKHGRR